ncbi:undecaprenyl/decaprenyl-phosphate alpha-N-acetylglucosaminyl 1-phosphate transferase [Bacillus sp. NTK074B]|uniref:glycosyltransferase family 4 protein n=1 Tax=Bacillus sp. NTK074B TaxID=2802174 RepID=UPI001A8E5C15|nr:undecaprenyl/decaprenyl-phosphate alpha-N-acetylglucosaminyl 1-phosphate transferase [Bacillus sp. NTK074B]
MTYSLTQYILAFLFSFVVSIGITPLVRKLAIKVGAIDKPEERKVHTDLMPRLGGVAIFIGAATGYLYLAPESIYMQAIVTGASIILVVGILDDLYTLSPKLKLVGQIIAALIVISSGLLIEKFTFPFFGTVYLHHWLSFPVTLLWIVGVTNAINLIDGLDGLAAGVSSIALGSILVMAVGDSQVLVIALCVILVGSSLGFLYHNFYPAKIFMGDTGALFLGYSIAIISMLGLFKNVALFSFIIPIIVLAIPIFDTIFAIIRRALKKQNFAQPDKQHLHYCILSLGFSHKASVLIIYCVSACFGGAAILFSNATLWFSIVIIFVLLLLIQFTAEIIGLIGDNRTPLLNMIRRITEVRKPQKNQ